MTENDHINLGRIQASITQGLAHIRMKYSRLSIANMGLHGWREFLWVSFHSKIK